MIRARVVVCLDAGADGVLVAPRDDRVDEAVAAPVREVCLVEALPEEATAKVLDAEVPAEICAPDLAGPARVALTSRKACSGISSLPGPRISRAERRRVRGRHVRMGSVRSLGRES